MDATKRDFYLDDLLPSKNTLYAFVCGLLIGIVAAATIRAFECACHEQAGLESENARLRYEAAINDYWVMHGIGLFSEELKQTALSIAKHQPSSVVRVKKMKGQP